MSAAGAEAEVTRLRARLERLQGGRMPAALLPVPPPLARLLPGGGLRPGAAYTVPPSSSLLLTLLAGPTRAGSWCAVVGMPGLGVEAAEQRGVELSRLVLIPDPGERWPAVTATVADVLPVVAVRPAGRVAAGAAARLSARLRDRGTVLLVQGAWPQAEASLRVDGREWSGLGVGHGHLRASTLTVSVTDRRGAVRRGRLLLPPDGAVRAAPPDAGSPGMVPADAVPADAARPDAVPSGPTRAPGPRAAARVRMRAVG